MNVIALINILPSTDFQLDIIISNTFMSVFISYFILQYLVEL